MKIFIFVYNIYFREMFHIETSSFSTAIPSKKDVTTFDREYYLATYKDVRDSRMKPDYHYMMHGEKEGRRPNRYFDPVYYKKTNPDVAKNEKQLFRHFGLYGYDEGRKAAEGLNISRTYLTSASPLIFIGGIFDESQSLLFSIMEWFYRHSMHKIILISFGIGKSPPPYFDQIFIIDSSHVNSLSSEIGDYFQQDGSIVFMESAIDWTFFSACSESMPQIVTIIDEKTDDGFDKVCSQSKYWVTASTRSRDIFMNRRSIEAGKIFVMDINRKNMNHSMKKLQKELRVHLIFPPLVSVVACFYNQQSFVKKRMESILSQTILDIEIILLDDCSSDKTWENILDWSDDPLVSYISRNKKNSGKVFQQWKYGVMKSHIQSKYVWIAEGDDFCTSDFLHVLLPYFNDPMINIASGKTLAVDVNEHDIHHKHLVPHYEKACAGLTRRFATGIYVREGHDEIRDHLGIVCTLVNVSGLLLRKSVFIPALEHVQEYKMCGDYMIYLRMLKTGKFAYDSRTHNFFRRHSGSVVHRFTKTLIYFEELISIMTMLKEEYSDSSVYIEKSFRFLSQEWEKSMKSSTKMTCEEWFTTVGTKF